MQKTFSLQIQADEETIRRAVAILTGETLSKEQINEKFCNREKPAVVNLNQVFGKEQACEISMKMVSYIVSYDNQEDMKEAFDEIFEPSSFGSRIDKVKNFLTAAVQNQTSRWTRFFNRSKENNK